MQVLKRVGQECEAHGVVYWTAAAVGDLIQFEVRRPYSIRTTREKGADVAKAGTSDMLSQLRFAEEIGKRLNDRPAAGEHSGGRPEVIVADVFATAALLKASREDLGAKHSLSPANILLYFDEPNMGLHLSTNTAGAAAAIMRDAPLTAVLASATLPGWGQLPAWWRGDGSPACRSVITTEPYDLPHAALSLLSLKAGTRAPISLLSLFPSHAAFAAAVRGAARRRILLLRHLTPAQANALLLHSPPAAAGAAEPTEAGLHALSGSVRTAREQLELAVLRLADEPERYEALRKAWAAEAAKGRVKADSLRAACRCVARRARFLFLAGGSFGFLFQAWDACFGAGDARRVMNSYPRF